ncbi:MAG: hypothetical protein ACYDCQ_11135 [Dehalococcoidia bacterium]
MTMNVWDHMPAYVVVLGATLAAIWSSGLAGAGGAPAQAPWTVQIEQLPGAGSVLADGSGMTLYTYDLDIPGMSQCDADCAVSFPPLVLTDGRLMPSPDLMGGLATIQRPDGSQQVTFNDQPLYNFSGDMQPGDVNGDGVDGLWHAARPNAGSMRRTGSSTDTDTIHAYDGQAWQPIAAGIAQAGSVTWENDDPTNPHSVRCVQESSSAPCPWVGAVLLPPAMSDAAGNLLPTAVTESFVQPGFYTFQCTIFPNMIGQIAVGPAMAPGLR